MDLLDAFYEICYLSQKKKYSGEIPLTFVADKKPGIYVEKDRREDPYPCITVPLGISGIKNVKMVKEML